MGVLIIRRLTFMLLDVVFIVSSHTYTCNARIRSVAASMYKKKGKSYRGNNHQGNANKPKGNVASPSPPPPENDYSNAPSHIFNVLDFGAKGYGATDDTKGGSGSVQGVLFSNIQVSEVQLPVIIDQYYCDKSKCSNQSSAVALSAITCEKIRGTYTVKPVHLACSDSLPCVDVTLTDIELKPQQEQYRINNAFCWKTFGQLNSPTIPPVDCLQVGKPSDNWIQTGQESC